MAVVDVEPPMMAAAENERQEREAAAAAVADEIDAMVTAKAKLIAARARESALIRERDNLQILLDHATAKLDVIRADHANSLGVRCDVCHAKISACSSIAIEPHRLVLMLYTNITIAGWAVGPATAAAMNELARAAAITPIAPTAERDLCHVHRSKP